MENALSHRIFFITSGSNFLRKFGARGGTRTPKGLLPLAPQASAFASFATRARFLEQNFDFEFAQHFKSF